MVVVVRLVVPSSFEVVVLVVVCDVGSPGTGAGATTAGAGATTTGGVSFTVLLKQPAKRTNATGIAARQSIFFIVISFVCSFWTSGRWPLRDAIVMPVASESKRSSKSAAHGR